MMIVWMSLVVDNRSRVVDILGNSVFLNVFESLTFFFKV